MFGQLSPGFYSLEVADAFLPGSSALLRRATYSVRAGGPFARIEVGSTKSWSVGMEGTAAMGGLSALAARSDVATAVRVEGRIEDRTVSFQDIDPTKPHSVLVGPSKGGESGLLEGWTPNGPPARITLTRGRRVKGTIERPQGAERVVAWASPTACPGLYVDLEINDDGTFDVLHFPDGRWTVHALAEVGADECEGSIEVKEGPVLLTLSKK